MRSHDAGRPSGFVGRELPVILDPDGCVIGEGLDGTAAPTARPRGEREACLPFTIEMFERATARLDIFYGRQTSRMPGNATPTAYMIDGKQYVVIATSGVRDLQKHTGRGIRRVGVTVTSFHKE